MRPDNDMPLWALVMWLMLVGLLLFMFFSSVDARPCGDTCASLEKPTPTSTAQPVYAFGKQFEGLRPPPTATAAPYPAPATATRASYPGPEPTATEWTPDPTLMAMPTATPPDPSIPPTATPPGAYP